MRSELTNQAGLPGHPEDARAASRAAVLLPGCAEGFAGGSRIAEARAPVASGSLRVLWLVAVLALGCGVAASGGAERLDTMFAGIAAMLALAALTVSACSPSGSRRELSPLEERIERLEDLRWQAKGDADYLRALLDEQNDIIIRRNREGVVKFVNRTFCRVFDISVSDISGHRFEPIVIDRDGALVGAQEGASGAGPRDGSLPAWAEAATQRLATSRGSRWIEWHHKRVALPSGVGSEIQSVGRDVTALREHELALAAARDQAEAADRAKSRFLASMSHEIRTPMNGILGMASLLRETELSPEQCTYADAIRQSARTLLGLIDEILDFSKIEAGRIELKCEPVDIAACVQEVVELMAPKALDKGLDLAWSLAPDLPNQVLCDETRLRQILLNLIGNAVKFTPDGGVTVWLGAEREAGSSRLHFKCVIRDTGPGLGEEARTRIFLEFERAVPVGSTTEGGTGLGLAIAQRLAHSMGGGIEVTSTPGRGSTFTLTLPLELVARTRALEVPAAAAGRHVAIVAKPGVERRTVADFLRALDIAVTEFDAGHTDAGHTDAIEAALDGGTPADLVLFDGALDPEAARRILAHVVAAQPSGRRVTSAVLTAPATRTTINRFRQCGIDHFLVRPVRPATLIALLDGSLGGSRQGERLPGIIASRGANSVLTGLPAKLRILLAEDNEINALLSRTILERLGCVVELAVDGREALDKATRSLDVADEAFDAVLMDLNMPTMNGFEASSRIRELCEQRGRAAPAIVAVTANAFEEDRAHCLTAGMDAYLAKPFEAEALQRVLEEVLLRRPALLD